MDTDSRNQMILIKGNDQTDRVASFRFCDGKCEIIYTNAPNKTYKYRRENVEVLPLQKTIDPTDLIVVVGGKKINKKIKQIYDFGTYYRVCLQDGSCQLFRRENVEIRRNCLSDNNSREIFQYFKEIAGAVGLATENGRNILQLQYSKVTEVRDDTVLACYFEPQRKTAMPEKPASVIFPFGLNQSQKLAVDRALSSKISIIQGPPGTGKTQTILNIIANVVRNGKTVAVVSNNNSAIRNVEEKMEKKGIAFLTAFLGNRTNKQKFLEEQSGSYPCMDAWRMSLEEQRRLEQEIAVLTQELDHMILKKNRIAEIEQVLLQLKPEQHYFKEYYSTYHEEVLENLHGLSSQKILELWLEFEHFAENKTRMGLLQKLFMVLRFNRAAVKLFLHAPEMVVPHLQNQFYITKIEELENEKQVLALKLKNYNFDAKMNELTQKSLRLFQAELAARYERKTFRTRFKEENFRWNLNEFMSEYQVILSTAYSIKGTLGNGNCIYDYLVIDEASQVDLATGVLAFSCARNVVIVGDTKQLPNILKRNDVQRSETVWNKYSLAECYHFAEDHSLLSSALETWSDAPVTLLREHYRCHPKIIDFCNQKFYNGQLIVMTKDNDEPDVLTMYRTTAGNHARGHINQRQIDVIQHEVLPRLKRENYQSVGIITPYRDQVAAIRKEVGSDYEVDTVHKFQGREEDAIILTSVDNVITDFVDDPRLLNVAVSRAVRSLTVITSQDPRNDHTNYGDLARYIEYNNFEIVQSQVYSVFDLLYQGYAEQRKAYLINHNRISEFDSENLMYAVIQSILSEESFSNIGCAVHVSLAVLIRDYSQLTVEETKYARNLLTHIDFLMFRKIDKLPILAVEVDGTRFHKTGSLQAVRDDKKNRILKKCGIPLLRLRTDGSNEQEKIRAALIDCGTPAADH